MSDQTSHLMGEPERNACTAQLFGCRSSHSALPVGRKIALPVGQKSINPFAHYHSKMFARVGGVGGSGYSKTVRVSLAGKKHGRQTSSMFWGKAVVFS